MGLRNAEGEKLSLSMLLGHLIALRLLKILIKVLGEKFLINKNSKLFEKLTTFGRVLVNSVNEKTLTSEAIVDLLNRIKSRDLNKTTFGRDTKMPCTVVITENDVRFLTFSLLQKIGRGCLVTLPVTALCWALLALVCGDNEIIK